MQLSATTQQPPSTLHSDLRTISEAAASLRVSEKTIRRAIKDGRLAACKVGHQFRLRAEDVARFLTPAAPSTPDDFDDFISAKTTTK